MGYNPPPGWQGPPQMRPYATPRAPENHSYPASSSHYSVPAYTGPPSHSHPSASANHPYSYNTAPSTYQNPPPAARPWAGPPVRPYQSLPGQVSRGPPSAAPPTAYQYGSHGPMTSQTGYASNLPNPTSAASSPGSYDPHSPASTLPASSFTGYPGATSSTRPVSSQQPYQPVPANTAQYGYSVKYAEDRGPPQTQGRPVFSYQPPIPHPQNNSQSRPPPPNFASSRPYNAPSFPDPPRRISNSYNGPPPRPTQPFQRLSSAGPAPQMRSWGQQSAGPSTPSPVRPRRPELPPRPPGQHAPSSTQGRPAASPTSYMASRRPSPGKSRSRTRTPSPDPLQEILIVGLQGDIKPDALHEMLDTLADQKDLEKPNDVLLLRNPETRELNGRAIATFPRIADASRFVRTYGPVLEDVEAYLGPHPSGGEGKRKPIKLLHGDQWPEGAGDSTDQQPSSESAAQGTGDTAHRLGEGSDDAVDQRLSAPVAVAASAEKSESEQAVQPAEDTTGLVGIAPLPDNSEAVEPTLELAATKGQATAAIDVRDDMNVQKPSDQQATMRTAEEEPPTSQIQWKNEATPIALPLLDAEEERRRAHQISEKHKTAQDIANWSKKQEELRGSGNSVATRATEGRASPKVEAPTADLPIDFFRRVADPPCCLLCSRQFKQLETLARHEQESALHKTNLADETKRKAGLAAVQKANGELKPSVGAKRKVEDPVEDSMAGHEATQEATASEEPPKYRDRAMERRAAQGYDLPIPAPKKVKNRSFEGPAPPAPMSIPVWSPPKEISEDNVGRQLLQSMGWTEGQGIGNGGRADNVEAVSYARGAGIGSSQTGGGTGISSGSSMPEQARESRKSRFDEVTGAE